MGLTAAQRDATILRRWKSARKQSYPSWWMKLAPGKGAGFWRKVDLLRKEAGVTRSDHAAIEFIVRSIQGVRHEHQRHH